MTLYDDTVLKRFWAKVEKTGGCWYWTGNKMSTGYGRLTVNYIPFSAHRLSYELHVGPIPDGLFVLHDCPGGDNPACVNPEHLWLGTQGDNMQDRAQKGRAPHGDDHWLKRHPEWYPRGSRHWHAKLTEDDVRTIRQRFRTTQGTHGIGAQLAREFDVSQTTISEILSRKLWTHVL